MRLLSVLALLVSIFSMTAHAGSDSKLPVVRPEPNEPSDDYQEVMTAVEFARLIADLNSSPEFAGVNAAVRIGSHWALIERGASASTAKPTPGGKTALDKILATVEKSGAAKASLHIQYKRTFIDENGKPQTEEFILTAGVASGAAAAAQASMDEAASKNHW